MENTIFVDVKSNGNGKYDVWMSTKGNSGEHYPNLDAAEIGEYTADLVDCLEEADTGKRYLSGKGLCTGIPEASVSEFTGMIVDIFEDFLEKHGEKLHNPEPNPIGDDTSNFYGKYYDEVAAAIESAVKAWDLVR